MLRYATDGTVDLHHLATGKTFVGLLALRDGGDAGDEYNYSPPERDVIVDGATSVETEVVRAGPIEARIRVALRIRIPVGARHQPPRSLTTNGRDARHDRPVAPHRRAVPARHDTDH